MRHEQHKRSEADNRIAVIGHITKDILTTDSAPSRTQLGGAAFYAATAAATLGWPTTLVTAAPQESPCLDRLRCHANLDLQIAASDVWTTFELDYTGDRRRLHSPTQAPKLTQQNLNAAATGAALVYLGPVLGECPYPAGLPDNVLVVGIQGWLRRVRTDGVVVPHLMDDARRLPNSLAVTFSELDHPDAEALAQWFSKTATVVALTRGAAGATLWHGKTTRDISPVQTKQVDPTGAGDVFGIVLGLALQYGHAPAQAGSLAAAAAASVVEGPGLGHLPRVAPKLRRAILTAPATI